MKRSIFSGILPWGLALAGFLAVGTLRPQSSPPAPPFQPATVRTAESPSPAIRHRALLDRYCVGCHNQKLRTAGLLLDKVDVENVNTAPEIWEKVSRKLRTGAMPPAGAPRPDKSSVESLADYLETTLDAAAAAAPNPGRPMVHRLNRVEYANSVRDLLGVEIDAVSLFPAEDSGKGFDNLAVLLSVSPLLMERYLAVAGKISKLAVGDSAMLPTAETYSVADSPRGGIGVGLITVQDDRASEDLPFQSRGGASVRHQFPADGDYEIKITLMVDGNYYIRGLLGEPHQLDLFLDGERIKSFSVGGERHGASGALHSRQGGIFIGDPAQQAYEFFQGGDHLEARFYSRAGVRQIGVTFLKKAYEQEGLMEVAPHTMANDILNYKGGDPGISTITITGPYQAKPAQDSPSRKRIFICHPAGGMGSTRRQVSFASSGDAARGNVDEEACATKILSALARRAFRRPVTADDIGPLLRLYRKGREENFEEGIRTALEGLLVSPAFLFRIEQDPPGTPPSTAYRISDYELASRLSYFLWSSLPDDTLLDAAGKRALRNPKVLESQVRRMLADPRSRALITNFAGQWLYLRNVRLLSPNTRLFPDFDTELRDALEKETELFFESMVREDHPVADLLEADYTFLNQRLAEHYGIPDIYGSHFRKVKLADENRRGLLGQGSILTVTSRANRTAPVLRGKWVLENILGTPPPPPPPDVPALSEKPSDSQEMTMRQRMEAHRANPGCASCHSRMDPIGFALENFNAVGKWRTTEGNSVLDPTGALPDGTRFQGPAELRKLLVNRREQLAQTVTEKLLMYALGRELEYYDMPAVRRILQRSAPSEYRWSSLILNVIESMPFQMRSSQP